MMSDDYKKYAGVGARSTPEHVLKLMAKIGQKLAVQGWVLRSGGTEGADKAFETGCDLAQGRKEIFLPWDKFNHNSSVLVNPVPAAYREAESVIGHWEDLTQGAKSLHARNSQQVLGKFLDDHSLFVICWTQGAREVGGTATALKIAKKHGITIVNLGNKEDYNSYSNWIEEPVLACS